MASTLAFRSTYCLILVGVFLSESRNFLSQAHVLHRSTASFLHTSFEIPEETEWHLVQLTFLTKWKSSTSNEYHIIQIKGSEAFNLMEFHLMKKRLTDTDFTIVVKNGDNESEETVDEELVTDCFYSAISSFDPEIHATFSSCDHKSGFSGVILNSKGHWRIEPHPDPDPDMNRMSQNQNAPSVMHIFFKINGTESWTGVRSDDEVAYDSDQRNSADEVDDRNENSVIQLNPGYVKNFDPNSSSSDMPNDPFNSLNAKTIGKGKKKPQAGSGNKKANTGKKAASTGAKVVEIAVFVDPPLWTKLQTAYPSDTMVKSREYVLTLINTMDLLYKQPSLGIPLKFRLVHLEIQKSWPSKLKHHKGSVDKYLDEFCDYNGDLNTNNQRWDHGLMLTGFDLHEKGDTSIAGVAFAETMCNRYYSCSLTEGYDFGAVYVLAHEIGHSVGMEHDGVGVSKKCARDGFIMAAYTGAGQVTWSPCSRQNLLSFLEYGNAVKKKNKKKPSCLSKLSSGQTAIPFSADRLPGQIYDAKKQCSRFFGPGYTAFLSTKETTNNLCYMLYCINKDKSNSAYPCHPALEGTPCSTTAAMHCRGGQCVE